MINSWRNLGARKSIAAKGKEFAKESNHLAQSLALKQQTILLHRRFDIFVCY
jgi:hypothetical protein